VADVTGRVVGAVPVVPGAVVAAVPVMSNRVVGPVATVAVPVVVDPRLRRGVEVVVGRSERRPGSGRRGDDQDAGCGEDRDALHLVLLGSVLP
jgi:hypothetical protein